MKIYKTESALERCRSCQFNDLKDFNEAILNLLEHLKYTENSITSIDTDESK